MRIFAWRYDTKKNLFFFILFMITNGIIILTSLYYLNFITDLKSGYASTKPFDDEKYMMIYKIKGEDNVYISYCNLLVDSKDMTYRKLDDILVRSNGTPFCPLDYIFHSFFLIVMAISWITILPVGAIAWFDFYQFSKILEKEKRE